MISTDVSNKPRHGSILAGILGAALMGSVPLMAQAQTASADVSAVVIVPTPQSLTALGGTVAVGPSVSLVVDAKADPAAVKLAKAVLEEHGLKVTVSSPENPGNSPRLFLGSHDRPDIAKVLGTEVSPSKAEGYGLRVTDADVVIGGFDGAGQYYGVQTFRQILKGEKDKASVVKVAISDAPDMPLRGAIEGFYGMPWNHKERLDQIAFYGDVKMNTYIYAPKDDPYHRSKWREAYPADKMKELKELVDASVAHHVRFTFALSPGESVCFSSQEDRASAVAKLKAMYDLGVRAFSIPLDDINYEAWHCDADKAAYGEPGKASAGKAQVDFLNYIDAQFIKANPGNYPLQMVPTEYSDLKTSPYKEEFKTLNPDIVIMWTGTDVVPPSVSKEEAGAIAKVWGRKVFLWDNYPVNDYAKTEGRLLLGAYDKREAGLSASLQGIVSNPMNQSAASKPALVGFAGFTWNDHNYDARKTWLWSLNYLARGDAELVTALETFGDLNFAAPDWGQGYWLPQAPVLKALSGEFTAAPDKADLTKLKAYADSMISGSALIQKKLQDKIFLEDASFWLKAEEHWGTALKDSLSAVEAGRKGDKEAAKRLVASSTAAIEKAKAIKITDDKTRPNAEKKPVPNLGDGVLDVLIEALNKQASV